MVGNELMQACIGRVRLGRRSGWRWLLASIQKPLPFANGSLPFKNLVLFLKGRPFRNFFIILERLTHAVHELPLGEKKIRYLT